MGVKDFLLKRKIRKTEKVAYSFMLKTVKAIETDSLQIINPKWNNGELGGVNKVLEESLKGMNSIEEVEKKYVRLKEKYKHDNNQLLNITVDWRDLNILNYNLFTGEKRAKFDYNIRTEEIIKRFNERMDDPQIDNKRKDNEVVLPKANYYKRGVFILMSRLSSGKETWIDFTYKNEGIRKMAGGFHLAIFNEIQFANWYLVNMIEDLKRGAKSDNLSANNQFYINEIGSQEEWDLVRKTSIKEGVAMDAVLNPCEGDEKHRCPITFVDFDKYADFNKLKEMFQSKPNKHFSLSHEGKEFSPNTTVILNPDTKIEF